MLDAMSEKTKKLQLVFISFFWFSLLFYIIALFYGANQKFREITPWYFLILRDLIFIGFLTYLTYMTKSYIVKLYSHLPNYKKFLKWFSILISIYLAIVFIHSFHKEIRDILQHYIRNIVFYSLVLFFLPAIFKSNKDFDLLLKNILYAGVILSLLGILTRYISTDNLTWDGRIISTMADPNNIAVFISLCIFIIIAQWNYIGHIKSILFITIYLIAFVIANSITAFAVANFGILIILLLKSGKWKGIALWLIIFYIMIALSLSIKAIENPNNTIEYLLKHSAQENRYIVDKLNNVTRGKFYRIFLFGFETHVSSDIIKSLSIRQAQISFPAVTVLSIMIGDLDTIKYVTFDNQYLNFIANSGIISVFIFLSIFSWGLYEGFKYWFKYKDNIILPFSIFILTMLIFGFNGAAFLNRFPINFLLYISLGLIFLKKDMERQPTEPGHVPFNKGI